MKNLYNLLGRTTHKTREAVQSYGSSFGKVTVFLFFLINYSVSYSQCTFRIQLKDSWGDGWNGGVISSVSVSGSVVLSNLSTANSTNWTNNGTFTAYNGESIAITYAPGSFCGENTYRIQRNNAGTWNTVYTSGTCPTGTYTITNNGCTVALPGCSGLPNTGTTSISAATGCSGTPVSLTSSGLSTGSGLTYQWQSSPNNSTWTNIAGATSQTYSAAPTATTYYRIQTTCSSSGLISSSASSLFTVVSCCTHTLSLYDSYGDGWNGGTVNLFVGGVLYGNYTVASGFGPTTVSFSSFTGQAIQVAISAAGSYPGEMYFNLTNGAGASMTSNYYPNNSGTYNGTGFCPAPCTVTGDQTTYGAGSWIGYVYDASTPGAFTNYKGYVTEPITFNRTHTTANGATVTHCSYNQDLFTIRYKNITNFPAGYYTFTVGGDDGVRFSIDGGTTWLINQWIDQGYTTTSNATPVYLSGNTNMVFEYYENGGGAQSSFSYSSTPACSGTPTPGNTLASVTSVISGGSSVLSLQNSTNPASYQWQSSSSSTGPWANIGGATSATYTATVNANTYYQCVVTCTASSTSAASTPVQVTVIAPPVNDACASATDLLCGTSSLAGTTVNAVSETAPGGGSLASPYGVWYTFTGNGQQTTISTTGTGGFDPEMTVLSGNCASLSLLSSVDNTGSNGTESYTFGSVSGTTYYVYVAYWNSTGTAVNVGTFTISRTCSAPAWTDAWVSMNTGSSNWCAGETRMISVTVTNTGSSTWTDATPDINIGVKWNAEADYFIRTDAGGLAPGATQTYNLTVTAPLTLGSNNLTFDIVNEFNFWFANNNNGGGPGNVIYTSPAITIVGSPTMNAGADQSVCQASSITLTDAGTGSTSVSWNNGVSNGVAFSAPSSTTTYIVTGTNAAGCTATDQVVLTIKPLPVVNAGADQTVCQGVIANLTGTVTGGSCIMSLTTSGGSFASEKWVNITTAANGGGTVVWAQGNGTIGNASGLLTNQSVDLSSYLGQTLYLNTYDSYADGWDGSVYNLSLNGTTVVNNAGVSPSNGTDADASGAWESIAAEMETSEAFTVPALTYDWTSSPAGFTSSSLTAAVSPTQTTTYTLSSTYAGCTGSDVVTITLPTAGSVLAQDNESATCTVNQNGWVHFYHSSGRLIASVNSQGQNLGAVTATSYVEGAPVSVDACTSSNPIYTTTVLGRHWVITPTNQPTSAVYVRLPYENTEFSDLTSAASTNANTNDDLLSPTDLGLSKYSNGTNTNVNDVATDNCGVGTTTFHTPLGNGVSTVYSSVNASYSDFSIPGFSEFWLHGSAQSSPLPVELLSFQANCQEEGNVNVTWTTASEHNSANFTVEKSRDGMNWTVLAALAGAGNSNQLINYSTIDNNPVGGVNYYRLTQIDFDGASETFNIASANCGDNSSLTTVKVYPNPSAGDFYIDFTSEEIIGSSVITIADARGMEVYSMNVEVEKGSNVFHIENLEVAPGMYYIKVSNGALTSSIVKHSLR